MEDYLHAAVGAIPRLGQVSGAGRLYLKLPSEQSPAYAKARAMLNMFPGPCQTVLYFADTGVRRGTTCLPEAVLLSELRALLGADSVVEK